LVQRFKGQCNFALPGPSIPALDADDFRLINDDFGYVVIVEKAAQRANGMIEDRRVAKRRRGHLRLNP
jgi:hypothetical protein